MTAQGLAIGSVVGPIRIDAVLAVGGMGQVYRGFHLKLGREVALKAIRTDRFSNLAYARFLREARLLSRLDDERICRIFDFLETPQGTFIIMELVAGERLSLRLAAGIPRKEALHLAAQLAGALVVAHGQGIVHRDLKPENIMVTPALKVKILDFGIAYGEEQACEPEAPGAATGEAPRDPPEPLGEGETPAMPGPEATSAESHTLPISTAGTGASSSGRLTVAGSVVGTPAYMSPEQISGEWPTPASDIYALGLVLAEMFSGEKVRPKNLNWRQVLQVMDSGDLKILRERDRDLRRLLQAMLARNPSRRPSAREVEQALAVIETRPQRLRRRATALSSGLLAILLTFYYLFSLQVARNQAIAARILAEKEKGRAQKVNDLLVGLFRQADPLRVETKDNANPSMRELIAHAAQQVLDHPDLPPEDAALLLGTLGDIHHSLGLYEEAKRLLTKAEEHLQQLPGEEQIPLWWVSGRLAMACHRLDHFAEARRHFENSLALSAARRQQDQGEILRVMTSYGDMLSELDDTMAAASIFLRAEELLSTMPGTDPLLVATVKHRHGNFLLRAGRLLDARLRWQEALEARARVLPENHPKISDLLNNLGYAAYKMGDMAEAENYLERAVVADEASLGSTHPDLAYSLSNLADVAVDLGDLERAESLARRALVIRERALGPHHLRVSYSLATLARIAALRGRWAESRALYQQALDIRQATLPAAHPAIRDLQDALAALKASEP